MNALIALWNVIKSNVWKVVIVFMVSGTVGVLGLVPGTENLSNWLGGLITNVKSNLGTTATPTIVQ